MHQPPHPWWMRSPKLSSPPKSFNDEGHVILGSVPFMVNIFIGQASQVNPSGNPKCEKHWLGHFLHIKLTKVDIRYGFSPCASIPGSFYCPHSSFSSSSWTKAQCQLLGYVAHVLLCCVRHVVSLKWYAPGLQGTYRLMCFLIRSISSWRIKKYIFMSWIITKIKWQKSLLSPVAGEL